MPPSAPLHVSRSAVRALDLLDAVITAGSLGLAEAAAATATPSSTALRHLRALADRGWLTRDDAGRYAVGPTFLRLGIAAFQAGPWARLTDAAQPYLEGLAHTTEESAYLAVRDGSNAVYLSTAEGTRAIRHVGWVGRSVPVVGTAVGDALLADDDAVRVNEGAVEHDVTAVCAGVRVDGRTAAAISVLGPAERLTGERRARAEAGVRDAADRLGRELSAMSVEN